MDERFPANQQQYRGYLIPTSLTTESDLGPLCENCEEFQEIRRDNHLRLKSCIQCLKEYAYCFCNQVCHKVTPGGISKNKYEYLTCSNGVCDFLGVRCTTCFRLCNIRVSRVGNIFWGCKSNNQCQFYKQNVLISLRNHIESCNDLLSIEVKTLCKFIFRYVENLEFINILKNLHDYGKLNERDLCKIIEHLGNENAGIVNVIRNEIISPTTPTRFSLGNDNISNIVNIQNRSPTPNVPGMSINELKRKFEHELKREFEHELNNIKNDFNELEKNLRNRTDNNFKNLKLELTSQNEKNFSNLEQAWRSEYEANINEMRKEFVELKEQNQKNNELIQDNFSALFKKLKIENLSDEEPALQVTRKSSRIKELNRRNKHGRR